MKQILQLIKKKQIVDLKFKKKRLTIDWDIPKKKQYVVKTKFYFDVQYTISTIFVNFQFFFSSNFNFTVFDSMGTKLR